MDIDVSESRECYSMRHYSYVYILSGESYINIIIVRLPVSAWMFGFFQQRRRIKKVIENGVQLPWRKLPI